MSDKTFDAVLKYAGQSDGSAGDGADDAATNAIASLETAKEEDSPDFKAPQEAAESEGEQWQSTANLLCGREDNKEGGE